MREEYAGLNGKAGSLATDMVYQPIPIAASRVSRTGNTASPRLPPNEIHRPRLLQQLDRDDSARIWVVTAPAGYGKSVLVNQWVSKVGHPVAWLSLRGKENQPRQFMALLRSAIVRALGFELPAGEAEGPIDEQMVVLLKSISELTSDLTLVFDDLHAVFSEDVISAIELMFDRRPDNLRIVITSRSEPKPALVRQRSAGTVNDVSLNDLTFTLYESRSFLRTGSGPRLSDDQIKKLNSKAEGWITGLSLFKLSIRDVPVASVDRIIERLTSGSTAIESFLFEEVVRFLRPELRHFIIRVSLLEYLEPDACDAALDIANSRALIRELDRLHLFVISVVEDDAPPRFHHLFSDALRHLLALECSEQQIREIHLRASLYFESIDRLEDAAHHAVAAADWHRSVTILTKLCADIFSAEKTETLWYWLKQLPTEGLFAASQLASWLAWSLAITGKRAEAISILDTVEPIWRANDDWDLAGEAAMTRSYVAFNDGDESEFLATSLEAVELIPDSSIVRKIPALGQLNLALRGIGDREGAAAARSKAHELVRSMPKDQTWWFAAAEYIEPAWMAIEGKLGEAIAYSNHLLTLVSDPTSPDGITYRALNAVIHLERNELSEAEAIARELVNLPVGYWNPARGYVILSGVSWARNRRAEAFELLEMALAHSRRNNHVVYIQGFEALRAWYWVAQGDLFLAQQWENITSVEEVSWMRMLNHFHRGLTSVRIAIEAGNSSRAIRVCRELLDESARRHRWGEMVRLHVLNALALHTIGDRDGVLSSLNWAVRLGQKGRFIRSFVDDGAPLVDYFSNPNLIATSPDFVRELYQLLANPPQDSAHEFQSLSDDLTQREIDVLKFVADGHTNRHIAEQLFIAEATVRKHMNNIFRKLNVTNRTQAVNRARQLGVNLRSRI